MPRYPGLAALLLIQAACIDVTTVPLSSGTTVMSFADGAGAYVLSGDSAGFLGTSDLEVERVSHFDCPPDLLGLELGPNDLTGEPLVPDEDSAGGESLGLGVPLEFKSSFGDFYSIREMADVPPTCRGSSVVAGRTESQRFIDVEIAPSGDLTDPSTSRTLEKQWAPCLNASLSVTLGASFSDPLLLQTGDRSIELRGVSRVGNFGLSSQCSDSHRLVAVGGVGSLAQVYVEWFEVVGETLDRLEASEFYPGGGTPLSVVMGFDPRREGVLLVTVVVEDSRPEVFEVIPGGSRRVALDFATPVASGLVVLDATRTTVLTSSAEISVSLCERPNGQVLDLARLPGRWVFVDDQGTVGVSTRLEPCLPNREIISLDAGLPWPRLIATPLGVLVGSRLHGGVRLHGIIQQTGSRTAGEEGS